MKQYAALPRTGDDDAFPREANLGLTKAVGQHVVPRFYLEAFADPDGMIGVMNIDSGVTFRRKPGRVAVQNNFNDVGKLNSGESVSTEPWLTDIEDAAVHILKDLARDPGKIVGLTERQERHVARFLAAQAFRVPDQREQMADMKKQLVDNLRPDMKHALRMQGLSEDQAEAYVEEYAKTPEGWFLNDGRDKYEEALITASLLAGVNGWANLVQAMDWRVGSTPSDLFTSDNPMAGLPPFDEPFGGAFGAQRYFFPLSKRVLLVMGPVRTPVDGAEWSEDDPWGTRERRDFGEWETSIARHVIALRATRFLYGSPPYVDKQCARECLRRVQQAQLLDAVRYQGHESWHRQPMPRGILLGDEPPRYKELHIALRAYLEGLNGLSAVRRWADELAFIAINPTRSPKTRAAVVNLLINLLSSSNRESDVRDAVHRALLEIEVEFMLHEMEVNGKTLGDLVTEWSPGHP